MLPGSCESQTATYGPDLGTFTRHLVERIRTSDTLKAVPRVKRRWVPDPKDPQTKSCRGYFTRTLACDYNVQLIAPDHRCDRTPALNRDPNPAQKNPDELYPNPRSPLAPFVDRRGRVSRLTYGRTRREPAPQPKGVFWFGFGYKKIAAKHGFGPADVTDTAIALKARAGRTLGKGKTRRVEYTGPVYSQNGTACERVVVIDYSYVNNRFGTGKVITSYGSSEADRSDPAQQ